MYNFGLWPARVEAPLQASVEARVTEFLKSRTQRVAIEIVVPDRVRSEDELVFTLLAQLQDETLTKVERDYAAARLMVHLSEVSNPEEAAALRARMEGTSAPAHSSGQRQMDLGG